LTNTVFSRSKTSQIENVYIFSLCKDACVIFRGRMVARGMVRGKMMMNEHDIGEKDVDGRWEEEAG
jgi:hypothetical protein